MSQRFLKKDKLSNFTEFLAEDYNLYCLQRTAEGKLHIARYEDLSDRQQVSGMNKDSEGHEPVARNHSTYRLTPAHISTCG